MGHMHNKQATVQYLRLLYHWVVRRPSLLSISMSKKASLPSDGLSMVNSRLGFLPVGMLHHVIDIRYLDGAYNVINISGKQPCPLLGDWLSDYASSDTETTIPITAHHSFYLDNGELGALPMIPEFLWSCHAPISSLIVTWWYSLKYP